MKAIGADGAFKLEDGNYFYEFDKEKPTPKNRELLVKIKAISVNPVDTKIRQTEPSEAPRVLGFDAVGIVEAMGDEVELFNLGDEVYYSGSPEYPGSNETFQLVDERVVARKPSNLSYNEAASLPLTALTASETLFDVFKISDKPEENKTKTLLIINGSGGVGSIATQIAKGYGLNVITTASREETKEWSYQMGADLVLDHNNDLAEEFRQHELNEVDYTFCTFNSDMYYETMIELTKVRGTIATIVAFNDKQDLNLLKSKSITLTHEYMYSRLIHQAEDIIQHHRYLTDVTEKVERGLYQPTVNEVLDGLSAENLYTAHQKLESNQMIGKLVINLESEED
ncbi:zinc-binding alcohol dehydrogenase family protein [Staphylococcus sp. SQ8-PEA]|uniref:Zinc-type alcohol dehydrogenase-like protein n=1 Tax=Staphylococcus marylandisciuri TaxID=2981529 RepID=A0ABT2QMC3_9STAP|nr:zinc-binding alcohol dehydrogenase family protein [Staphylococcus marylandisciuri]MCU5745117.1 zinc-binding alcohol dehydrogenase family protein [Staphylococcus marylandisciuri]